MSSRPGRPPAGPRNGPPQLSAGPVSVAGVTLDLASRRAIMPGGDHVVLTPLQAAVLGHLMRRAGRTCTREELMCQALGYSVAVGSRTVDVHIATLRGKLGGALAIRSVRGVGYVLEPAADQ